MDQKELENNRWMGIEGQQFQLTLDKKQSSTHILEKGGLSLRVISDPVQERRKRASRWKIVNWVRRVTGREYEDVWIYKVKIV